MDFLSSIFNFGKSIFSGAGNALSGLFNGGGSSSLGGMTGGFGGGSSPARSASGNTVPMAKQLATGSLLNSPYQNGAGPIAAPTQPKQKKNFLDYIFPGGKTAGIAGIAAPVIGNMFAPKSPKIPDINSLGSVQAMQSFKPGNSISPEYKTMLDNNNNRLRDQRVRDLQATYRSARPGTDYLTDTNYQRDLAEIERQVQSQSADDLAKAEGTFSSQEQEKLSQIAQMDIYSIMMQTGLDAQEANDFKQMFSNVGNMLLTKATKDPNEFDLMSMFGGR